MKNTQFIQMLGQPGSGKSTLAHSLASYLSVVGFQTEYVPEVAKELIWQGRRTELKNQVDLSARTFHRMIVLKGKLDVVVCDGHIQAGKIYSDCPEAAKFIDRVAPEFPGLNILVRSELPYITNGRKETHEQAIAIGKKITAFARKLDNVKVFTLNPMRSSLLQYHEFALTVENFLLRNRQIEE